MATLAELNIIFKAKGLSSVNSGIQDLNKSIKNTSLESSKSRKNVQMFDRSLRELSSGLRSVQQLASFISISLGGPLVAAAINASKSNVELANSFREIRNAGTDFTSSIGQSLVPIANELSKTIRKMTDAWLELPKATRDSIVSAAAWTAGIAAATSVAARFSRIIIGLTRFLIRLSGLKAFGLLAGGALGGASALGGVGLLSLIKSRVLAPGKNSSSGIFSIISDAMGGFFNPASIGVKAGLAATGASQKSPLDALGSSLPNVDLGSIRTSDSQAGSALSSTAKAIQDIRREINKTFGELAVGLPTLAQTIASQLKFVFESLSSGIGNAVAQSIVFGENFRDSMINVLKRIAAEVIEQLTTIAIKKAALGFLGGGFGGALGGIFSGIGSLLGLAEGGVVTKPTVAMIGESGPEAVVPLDKMDSMGGSVTLNFSGHTFLNDESAMDVFARKISNAVKRASGRRTGGVNIAL